MCARVGGTYVLKNMCGCRWQCVAVCMHAVCETLCLFVVSGVMVPYVAVLDCASMVWSVLVRYGTAWVSLYTRERN